MREVLEKVKNGVLDALFPAACVGCGRDGKYVCERCTLFLVESELVCPGCLRESSAGEIHAWCQKQEALDALVSVWEYEGLMKTLLRTIKEGRVSHALNEVAELALLRLSHERERYAAFLETLLSRDVVITFLPLSEKTYKRQGFDHSLIIARSLGHLAKKEVAPLFKKLHDISSSDDWSKERERKVLESALIIDGNFPDVFPRQVVVVDDLWQREAMLNEAAMHLKRAGVEKVWGFTLARTP